jgi:hypothetical protein
MKIEVLYVSDCPNHPPTVERIKHVLATENLLSRYMKCSSAVTPRPRLFSFLGLRLSASTGRTWKRSTVVHQDCPAGYTRTPAVSHRGNLSGQRLSLPKAELCESRKRQLQ